MTAVDRYVVLGVAHVRSPWFGAVARWATGGLAPLEFVKCLSLDEARARLASGRPFSALLVDGDLPGLDRDLIDRARELGCAVLVVATTARRQPDWASLGAAARLERDFDAATLLDALATHAQPIARPEVTLVDAPVTAAPIAWRGRLVAVTGVGGRGISTVARALAQGLARDPRYRGKVLLADLALHADQALLHDVRDVVPGVQELVEAHRLGVPDAADVAAMTFADDAWGYSVLLGLRRHRDWVAIRPRAFQAALDNLRLHYTMVIADVEPDLEGQDECGSFEVEDRNLMARLTAASADAVVVVIGADPTGLRRGVSLVDDLLALGVDVARILPVVNRAPRHPRARAEITAAVHELTRPFVADRTERLRPPAFLPERKKMAALVRDGAPLPAGFCSSLAAVVARQLDELSRTALAGSPELHPVAVVPGSLGSWAEQEEATG